MTPYCGPGEEGCVSSQTLKDESCLVPCSGLYADIADDSLNRQNLADLEKNVLEGVVILKLISLLDILQAFSH